MSIRVPFQPGVGPTYPPTGDPFGGGGGGGGGFDIPGTGGYGKVCPPGYACSGPSLSSPLGSLCLGSCYQDDGGGGGGGQPPGTMPLCPAGQHPEYSGIAGAGYVCVPDVLPFDPDTGGGGGDQIPSFPPQGGGCTCNGSSCQLPNGRKGRLNKSRYYRFGDCRRGTQPGVVNPGTVCTTPRRTNYGNDKAAMRAARRLNGAARHYHKMIDAVDSINKAARRRPSRKR